jgi:lipopolysaccharide transport system permease protein
LSAACASFLDSLVSLVLAVVIAIASGIPPSFGILTAPLFVLVTSLLGFGIGLVAAALMVKFRDVQHMLPVLVQLALFASPLAFPVSAIPVPYRWFFHLNPLAGLIEGLRWSILGLPAASWTATAAAVAVAIVMVVLGLLVFRTLERDFADAI